VRVLTHVSARQARAFMRLSTIYQWVADSK
jgi:hypothetical protein